MMEAENALMQSKKSVVDPDIPLKKISIIQSM
jgi:hypothetical protein